MTTYPKCQPHLEQIIVFGNHNFKKTRTPLIKSWCKSPLSVTFILSKRNVFVLGSVRVHFH